MDQGPETTWTLNEDRRAVTVTFHRADPPTSITLTLREVEDILRGLGESRQHMLPEVPLDHPQDVKVVGAVRDPKWNVASEVMMGDPLLQIRDPRFGWLHYVIPREWARQMVKYLQNVSDAPPPGQTQGKAN